MENLFSESFLNNPDFMLTNLADDSDIDNVNDTDNETNVFSKDKVKTTEDRLKEINEKLEELRNLQLLNQLDVINLKNQIEVKRLVTTGMSQLDQTRLSNLIKLSKDSKELEKIRIIAIELQNLKDIVNKKNVGGAKTNLDSVEKEIDIIEKRLNNLETKPSIKHSSPRKDVHVEAKTEAIDIKNSLNMLTERISKLETDISSKRPPNLKPVTLSIDSPNDKMKVNSLLSEMGSLKGHLDILTQKVNAMKPSIITKEEVSVPTTFQNKIEELNEKINALSKGSRVVLKPLKMKSKNVSENELRDIISKVDDMHDEINQVLKITKLDEVEKMIKRNREIEKRLKKLIAEMHGIKLIHPLKEYKKEPDAELKKNIKKLEKKIHDVLKKSKPLKESAKIKHMENKINHLEDEVENFKKSFKKQKIVRKKMVSGLRKKIIKLSRTY
ncbi:MAG: hypothetical protein ABIF08_00400 [Nanoarchaeota archaeon]